jgi:hypothetical protein
MIRNRLLAPACLALLGAIALSSVSHCADAAEEVKLRRWAIIATEDQHAASVGDLLTARLTEQKGIELVERERLDAVLREIKLSALSGSTAPADRLSLGKLLKADGLVIISIEKRADRSILKTVFCETSYGLRLRVEYHSTEVELDDVVKRCADSLGHVRAHYAAGIKKIIGVPSLVSKNLSHDYDHLQAGYAGLLHSALTAHPGVAVIETEEARLIGRELGLGTTPLKDRVSPMFVEGEFRMSHVKSGEIPSVSLTVNISDANGEIRKIRHEALAFGKIPQILLEQLPRDILRIEKNGSLKPLSMSAQFDRLAARADSFSSLGAWEHSIGLREAALLIKPDSAEQRIALVADYIRGHQLLRESISRDVFRRTMWKSWREFHKNDRERAVAVFDQIVEPWRIMLRHFVRLVEEKELNPREAALLLAGIREIFGNIGKDICLDSEHERFSDAIASLYPSVRQLDASIADGKLRPVIAVSALMTLAPRFSEQRWTEANQYDAWASELLRSIASTPHCPNGKSYDARLQRKQDYYDRLYECLDQVSRDDMPPITFVGRLFAPKMNYSKTSESKYTDALVKRLSNSKSKNVKFYGRYGRWASTVYDHRLKAKAVGIKRANEEIKKYHREAGAILKVLGHTIWLKSPLKDNKDTYFYYLYRYSINLRILSKRPRPKEPPNGIISGPVNSKTEFPKIIGIEPLNPGLRERKRYEYHGGKIHKTRFETHALPKGMAVFRANADVDVAWTSLHVEIRRRGKSAVSWGVPQEEGARRNGMNRILDVVSDGKNIWVATARGGIVVLSLDGTERVRVNKTRGLPEYLPPPRWSIWDSSFRPRSMLRLHGVSPERCIAVGVMGPHRRVWVADITLSSAGRDCKIKIIHEAKQLKADTTRDDNPHVVFLPDWLEELRIPGPPEQRLLLVGRVEREGEERKGRKPLAIDLKTGEVFVAPILIPSFGDAELLSKSMVKVPGPPQSFAVATGRLFYAMRDRVVVYEPPADVRRGKWSCRDVIRGDRKMYFTGRILMYRGFIFCSSSIGWRIIHPKTLEVRGVESSYKKHNGPRKHMANFAVTANAGFIGWFPHDCAYRIVFSPDETMEPTAIPWKPVKTVVKAKH